MTDPDRRKKLSDTLCKCGKARPILEELNEDFGGYWRVSCYGCKISTFPKPTEAEAVKTWQEQMGHADPEDDARDGVLFRFWIRAAAYPGGWPRQLMEAINTEIKAEDQATPAAYRRALLRLAKDKGVNLP